MAQVVEKWLKAIPAMKVARLSLTQEEGLVTSHWETTGTHKEDINGIKVSQKPVKYRGVTFYRFDKDKIVEYWAYVDGSALAS